MHLAFTMDKEPLTNTYFGTDVPIIRCPKSHFKKSPTFLFSKLRASERRLLAAWHHTASDFPRGTGTTAVSRFALAIQ